MNFDSIENENPKIIVEQIFETYDENEIKNILKEI